MLGVEFGSDAKRVLRRSAASLAIVEYSPNGKMIAANEKFCRLLGYGRRKSKASLTACSSTRMRRKQPGVQGEFWAKLARGETESQEYKCVEKTERKSGFKSSTIPSSARPGKCSRLSRSFRRHRRQIAGRRERRKARCDFAIAGGRRILGRREFLTAKREFPQDVGFSAREIKGKHHRTFVDPTYARSPEYQEFWRKLKSGEFVEEEKSALRRRRKRKSGFRRPTTRSSTSMTGSTKSSSS